MQFNGRHLDRFIHLLMFGLLLFILLVSHRFDWDYFYTSFEADLQSWFVDYALPVWSYSFCAGSPRIADPQAFGLSPLFIFILLFGTVPGAKILFLALSIMGYFSFRYLLERLCRLDRQIASYLSLYFTLGYYFFWHGHAGQITFALIHLWVISLALCLQLLENRRFQFRPFILLIIVVMSGLTAGFYHSVVFFLLPVTTVLFPAMFFIKSVNLQIRGLLYTGTALATAVVLSLYKLLPVIRHQAEFPRTVTTTTGELSSLSETLMRLFLPTHEDRFLGIFSHDDPYAIWEYASFTWNHVTLFFCLYLLARYRKVENHGVFIAALLLVVLGVLLSMGDFSRLAPFSLLNEYVFHESMRVAGRFLIVASFGITLLQAAIISKRDARTRSQFLQLQRAGILVFILIPWSFYPGYGYSDWQGRYTDVKPVPAHRQAVIWLPGDEVNNPNTMYQATIEGISVLNCYSPFHQERRIHHGDSNIWQRVPFAQPFHFVKVPEATDASIAGQCLENSYYTAREIQLDEACPVGTCLVMNGIAPADPVRNSVELDEGLYCKVHTPISDRPTE